MTNNRHEGFVSRDEGYPWVPFEETVRRLRPGRWDARVLDQDQVWVDSAAVVHFISDLDDDHLTNIIAMLRREVLRVMVDHELAEVGPDGVGDPGSPLWYAAVPLSLRAALAWLEQRPLWGALQAEMGRRGLTAPGAVTRLEGTAGVWAVRTHDATYVLDLDESQVLHLPAPGAGPLRADRNWAPLRDRGQIQLGSRTWLAVSGQGRRHLTTPVTGIRRLPTGLSDPGLIHEALTAWHPNSTYWELTIYRTDAFMAAAVAICDYWAGLTRLLQNAGVHAPVLIVPRRLRKPDAAIGTADLCLPGPMPAHRRRLQAAVDDLVGFHLTVTTRGKYAVDPVTHAVPLQPTPPRTAGRP